MKDSILKVIEQWKNNTNVKAILLVGSYASGLHTKTSDVDLRIIIKGNSPKKEKRIEVIDAVEYSFIIGSIDAFAKQIEREFYRNSKFEARVFHTGKILYDTDGELLELKEDCSQIISQAYQKSTTTTVTFQKYKLHKEFQNYTAIDTEHFLHDFYYQHFLKSALNCYATHIQFDVFGHLKLHKILFDKVYMKANHFEHFPDEKFIALWKSATAEKNTSLCKVHAKNIVCYIESKWGTFSTDKLSLTY
jgi:predicted nucleotidyltransferase